MAAQTFQSRGVQPAQREGVSHSPPGRNWKEGGRSGGRGSARPVKSHKPPAEHEILFQRYFKSVGPRTYAAQVKKAGNGNHYLVLTEGKRDDAAALPRLTRLFLFSEDFPEFFKLMRSAAEFIKANPVPPDVAMKRRKHWQKQQGDRGAAKVAQ